MCTVCRDKVTGCLLLQTERQRVVMWHSYTEMQVLLRLDYHGSAVVRRDDLVRTLWEKGDLKPNVSDGDSMGRG